MAPSQSAKAGNREVCVGYLPQAHRVGGSVPKTSIILPVMNEVESLNATVGILCEDNDPRDFELVIVTSHMSTQAAINNAAHIATGAPCSVQVLTQTEPLLGGALITGFQAAQGTHLVMMASDLETDPRTVRELIATSRANPDAIIATTRWVGADSGFQGYGRAKKIANWTFQKSIQATFGTSLSDLTYGFRLYPAEAVQNRVWTTRNFAFLLESLLRPLRDGVPACELPTTWRARTEGKSSNSWRYYATYLRIAAQIKLGK